MLTCVNLHENYFNPCLPMTRNIVTRCLAVFSLQLFLCVRSYHRVNFESTTHNYDDRNSIVWRSASFPLSSMPIIFAITIFFGLALCSSSSKNTNNEPSFARALSYDCIYFRAIPRFTSSYSSSVGSFHHTQVLRIIRPTDPWFHHNPTRIL